MKRVTLLVAIGIALVACDKQENKPDQAPQAAAPTTAPAAAPPPAIAEADIVTPADYEEEADKEITVKNYKAELASLETDVAKE